MGTKRSSGTLRSGSPKHSGDARRSNAASSASKGNGKDGARLASTVRRLKMYRTRAKRDSRGKLISEEYQSRELPKSRVDPDRRWFGNSRVVGQSQLRALREAVEREAKDPRMSVLSVQRLQLDKLQARCNDGDGMNVMNSGWKRKMDMKESLLRRKRPNLSLETLQKLQGIVSREDAPGTDPIGEEDAKTDTSGVDNERQGDVKAEEVDIPSVLKGQSRRIWSELFKVVDSSDVVIEVLDARDPLGTRCRQLERKVTSIGKQKHIVLLLNKCDLVPASVTRKWVQLLSKEYPTLAFHASVTNPFGKGALLSLLRQLARFHGKKQVTCVGFVGYPNVGKSSVINTLKGKKACKAAPIPGETKVWQYVTLSKKIYLIDCPGTVHADSAGTDTDRILRGVLRVEKVEDAPEHIQAILNKVDTKHLRRAYKLESWRDHVDFLRQIAIAYGKMLPRGEPDLRTAARMVLLDWQRGRIPYFERPPAAEEPNV